MTIHLVIPGLFGPLSGLDIPTVFSEYPVIRKILARSDCSPGSSDYQQTLFELLGISGQGDQDLPTAAVSLSGEGGDASSGTWLHADPVTFKADGDRLLLFDADALDLCVEESEALVTAFNAHFGCDGLQLHAPVAERWYVRTKEQPKVRTSPLAAVVGRNIDPWLPKDEQANRWCQIINEVQMLFYQHPVNLAREAQGKLPVSGLWFSGCGVLPAAPRTTMGQLYGTGPLINGLGLLSQTGVSSVTDNIMGQTDDVLVLNETLLRAVLDGDETQWREHLSVLEQLLGSLMKTGNALSVYSDGEWAYHWQPKYQWRIWRNSIVQ